MSINDFVKLSLENIEIDFVLYIEHLENENLKLHSKIAKLQVTNLSISNEKKAMEKELAKLSKPFNPNVIFLPKKE